MPPAASGVAGAPILAMRGVVKQFTGTLALDGVDFDIRAGEIHALLGQNGAGKSTLIKVLAGVHAPTAGEVLWHGEAQSSGTWRSAITFIHQDLGLVDSMTVAENVAVVAGYPRRGPFIDWRAAGEAARHALQRLNSDIDPGVRVGTLSAADKSIVAIARALVRRCEILVLDEPTAALPAADVDRLLATLQALKSSGLGILYVTHRLDEVFRIADRVTVLRDGRRVACRTIGETTPQDLVQWIVGRALAQTVFATEPASDVTLLTLDDVLISQDDGAGTVGPVSLAVHHGETLGLVGLRGAGHQAVGRALFGTLPVHAGVMMLAGRPFRPSDPADAMNCGVGFVSSRRAEESLAGPLSVLENLFCNANARGIPPWRPVNRRHERVLGAQALARFSVRPPDPAPPIATLSGGNQQKVVVARWMEANVDLLILEEPTIGVDVGSKAEIYRDLELAHRRGRAVLLISSDFEEVEKVCHRVVVFNRGRPVAEIARPDITVARLTALAAGSQPVEDVAA